MIAKLKSVQNHRGFLKYFFNTGWLMLDKVLRMFLGLFVGVWVARYLGPEDYGILSYVLAFTNLFNPFRKLGLDGIVSRDVAKNEDDIGKLLSTAMFLKFLGGLLILVIVSTYMFLTKDNKTYFYISVILSLGFLAKSFEVLEFYFRARVKGKLISIANSISVLLSALLRVIFVLGGFSLVYFTYSNLLEAIIAGTFLLAFFNFQKSSVPLSLGKASLKKGISLLKESWPLIFSGFFAALYLNIDQVMIEGMLTNYEVGQYSAAVKISSVWYFIPLTVGWSVQTAIVNAKKHSERQYYERLQMLFTLMALMAYVLIIPISFFSDEIIALLFGEAYSLAGGVLALHIVASLFVFVGSPRGLWIINESLLKFSLISSILGAIVNIAFNLILIPIYGIEGAAIATLLSYFLAQIGFGIFYKKTSSISYMQLKAFILYDIKLLKKYFR